ncbi:hypothetical protein GQR58_004901 [Nymphon striatum]|nr:hypothetical protein GQR58_004901 [Nymphon striatum]
MTIILLSRKCFCNRRTVLQTVNREFKELANLTCLLRNVLKSYLPWLRARAGAYSTIDIYLMTRHITGEYSKLFKNLCQSGSNANLQEELGNARMNKDKNNRKYMKEFIFN